MMLIMKRYYTLAVIALFCWSTVSAQQGLPSRSLTIEGAYNPTMTSTEKVMPVPERPVIERKPVEVSYLTGTQPLTSMKRNPMGAFSETSDDMKQSRYSGLVRFGYGVRNVHDGLADFNWNISDKDNLKVTGLLDAWNTVPSDDWRSRMFNGDLNAVYSHRFDGFTLSIDGAFGHSHFNYRPSADMDTAQARLSSLMQKINGGEFGVSLTGTSAELDWHLNAGMEFLSRKGLRVAGTERTNKERLLRIDAGIGMPLLGGTGGFGYRQKTAMYDWQGWRGCDYSGFTALTFSPYWEKSGRKTDVHFGINLDFRTGAGNKFLASPMITLMHDIDDRYKLVAGMTGGLEDNAMRNVSAMSPYWSEIERIRDGYTTMNLFMGAAFSQGTWLTLGAKAGYRHTVDELFQTVSDSIVVTSLLQQQSSNVLYFRLDADMLFANGAQLKMDLTYNDYLGDSYMGKMKFKPAFDINVYGSMNLARGLDAMLSYKMRLFHRVSRVAMPAVNDLAFTLDYDISRKLSFYGTVKHLFGGDFYYYAGYRVIKPSVLVGLTYRF